ncbi:MinD/ParA family protein [Sinomonas sp. JGH33]|uniref:MinD/ParA family protein n=1 Tax=Sinomonas terricola TaxID=3110330 RepID=A0ABU5T3F0_9MICC|nr:MinD/ParA family protein [Sinomonas sp. JGH33]MEA5453651.1 MinD/ParA family protein [Sinomonas sp. JGH33]
MVDDGTQQAETAQAALGRDPGDGGDPARDSGEAAPRHLTRRELRKMREAEEAARAEHAELTWDQLFAAPPVEPHEAWVEPGPALGSIETPADDRAPAEPDTRPLRAVVPPLPEAPPLSALNAAPDSAVVRGQDAGEPVAAGDQPSLGGMIGEPEPGPEQAASPEPGVEPELAAAPEPAIEPELTAEPSEWVGEPPAFVPAGAVPAEAFMPAEAVTPAEALMPAEALVPAEQPVEATVEAEQFAERMAPAAQLPEAVARAEQPAGFVKAAPSVAPRGFRGFLYRITGGALNLGPTAAEEAEAELDRRIRRRLDGSRNTVFLSLKGGVGKTSTTVGVGLTLADLRSGSVCAIDANPDAGDLIERALGEGAYESERELNITRLVRELGDGDSRVALDRYLHEVGRLRLLAGEQDPDISDSLRAEDYQRIYGLVSLHYGVTLTDCGTGVSRPSMRGILESADNVVVASGFAVSGAKRARDTLAWLAGHGFAELAENAIVVVTDKDDVSGRVDKHAIEATLAGMCRTLISVPHDRAVADGDLVSLETVRPETRRAYKEIAAAIVDGYR